MEIILYSTHCPKCNILEQKLKTKNIDYQEITDVDTMTSKGFQQVQILEVNVKIMDFVSANKWINEYDAKGEM